jgi:hypothetical protein
MIIENLTYSLNWEKFRVGQSFFVPCIDHVAAKEMLKKVTRRLRTKVETKVVVEDGIKGLRVWRV